METVTSPVATVTKTDATQKSSATLENPPSTTQPLQPHTKKFVPAELGKLIKRDKELVERLGFKKFLVQRRKRGDFNNLSTLKHPAKSILNNYKSDGVPVNFKHGSWSQERLEEALKRGPHKSANEHVQFLTEEFVDMINKEQWVILPYDSVKDLPGLTLSPPGVIPQRDRRPRWIGDYTWSEVNPDTDESGAPIDAMQYGRALDRILREILMADPKLGHVLLLKADLSDGFYRINLRLEDIPKLALLFPTVEGQPPLVALPLCLPMGWKLSPPHFCAVTETITDVANRKIKGSLQHQALHKLDERASKVHVEAPATIKEHPPPDPNLPTMNITQAQVDVFVDDLIAVAQGDPETLRKIRSGIFDAIDSILRPVDDQDSQHRTEPISLKKLDKGDCTWATSKLILGWIVDTVNLTISLPEHRAERLKEILDSIPRTQKRTSRKKWHKVLGELRSMTIALPGARGLFSQMQHALTTGTTHRINLSDGVHDALDDFRYLHENIVTRPTRIQELVPLAPSIINYHDASGYAAGGALLPTDTAVHRDENCAPIVWRMPFTPEVQKELVSFQNPNGKITNSDLELAAAIVSNDAAAQNFDVKERTILSNTDNSPTLFWMRKGSTTTTKAPSHLLRAQAMHQRFHRYVHRIDFIRGIHNDISDVPSRKTDLSDNQLISYFNLHFPQKKSWKIWTPPAPMQCAINSCLLRKTYNRESLLVAPPANPTFGSTGPPSAQPWPSIPYSRPSKTPQSFSRSMLDSTEQVAYHTSGKPYEHQPLRMPYGQLDKRSPVWGPQTPEKMQLAR
jgi:hypothetical protein